jgi:exportin-2 (importin alpha re-exporter)
MSSTPTPQSRSNEFSSSKSTNRPSEYQQDAKHDNDADSRFTQADVRPFAENILMALFANIEKGGTPEKIAENDYLMKCECRKAASTGNKRSYSGAMRVIITARQSLTPSYEGILSRLVNILGEISKNPSNPKFNQYCFESVSALIR